MRIVLVGTVESTAVTFDALSEAGRQPVAVVGLDPLLRERHSDFVDMGAVAARAGIPFVGVRSVNDAQVVARIAELEPDWLVVVGWSQICREPLLAVPRLGSIGYHPAPLPELRGRAVLAWTILLGRTATAGTLFRLAAGVDSGAILAQHGFDLTDRETLPELMAKHMAALRRMWKELAPRLGEGDLTGIVQDETRASYCARRTAGDGLIDWSAGATQVDRLIRAVTRPYPGAFGWLRDRKLTIWQAEPWSGPVHYGAPGQIVARLGDGLLIACSGNTALVARQWDCDDASMPRTGERIGMAPAFEARHPPETKN